MTPEEAMDLSRFLMERASEERRCVLAASLVIGGRELVARGSYVYEEDLSVPELSDLVLKGGIVAACDDDDFARFVARWGPNKAMGAVLVAEATASHLTHYTAQVHWDTAHESGPSQILRRAFDVAVESARIVASMWCDHQKFKKEWEI